MKSKKEVLTDTNNDERDGWTFWGLGCFGTTEGPVL